MKLRIRMMREDNDLYQRNLAEFLGCTQQTYSRYETGELEPSLIIMEKLARFYDTSIDYLMGLTDVRQANWNSENLNSAAAVESAERRQKVLSAPKLKRGRKPKAKPDGENV